MNYLQPTDKGAFQDMEPKPIPCKREYMEDSDPRSVICAKCKGHGGWNLTLNAYGEGKHFQSACSNCNGWGWVEPALANHIHEWHEVPSNEGMFMHKYECAGCGDTMMQDSSG